MKQKQSLSTINVVGLGFLLFAMFLGAGNIIFPPMAGLKAGTNLWYTTIGFVFSGVGLPLLGIIASAKVGGGFNDLTKELPKLIIILSGCFIFLIIGPVYAVPRTALVAFETGILPFSKQYAVLLPAQWAKFFFSSLFFGATTYFCLSPGKLLEYIGKFITPALIILLVILGLSPIFSPIGEYQEPILGSSYDISPMAAGFLEGYMTMDALAALMFGIVIITNLRSHGITDQKAQVRYSIITGFIAAIGLSLVYVSLLYLGASSGTAVPKGIENGGQLLAWYVEYTFNQIGIVMLSVTVILACLTTAVGCITAACEYFADLLPISYRNLVLLNIIICVFLANLGLEEIIKLFVPVLNVLYPPCILVIFLCLIKPLLPNPTLTDRSALCITVLFSLIDTIPQTSQLVSFLPGGLYHFAWLFPALITIILSIIFGKAFPHKQA